MVNILIPAAGRGTRFLEAGYTDFKPFIQTVSGYAMIELVRSNLELVDAEYTYVFQYDQYENPDYKDIVDRLEQEANIVLIKCVTEGAASTTLTAAEFIDSDDELIIANSDQYIDDFELRDVICFAYEHNADGVIVTFEASDPKWSYIKTDENGLVTEVTEKNVISSRSCCGIFYWRTGKQYLKYCREMIESGKRVNGETYCSVIYNDAIRDGARVYEYKVDGRMHGLGVPEDLYQFIKSRIK